MKFLRRMEPTEKAEAIAVIASVFMAAGMISVALLSGSVSVLAEGIDTCVDIITSIAVIIGLKLSQRRSRDFPYGLYKIENIVTVAIAVLILYSAYELAKESIGDLLSAQETISSPWVAMTTMAVVALITGLLAWNKGRVGKRENSPSLLADSRHSWTDTIASAGVVVGLALNAAGVPYVDSLMALAIAAILAWSGVQVAVNAFKVLLDASVEQDVLDKATTTAQADPRVRRVVRVDGRNSGSYRFLQMSLVPESLDLLEAEQCAQEVRDSVKAAVQNVESVQVELVADEAHWFTIAVPLQADKNTIADDLATADSYALLMLDAQGQPPDGGTLILQSPTLAADPGRAINLAVAVAKHGADRVVIRAQIPAGGPLYVLAANSIDVLVRPDLQTLEHAESSVQSLRDQAGASTR
ncbi:MAG: cation diffusion facilitator family transporter [Actinomycetes bacterium]